MQCCLEPLGQHCTRLLPAQCCPKSIKTTSNRIFPVQCCLEPPGQHCTSLLPVPCCPKRIKTTLNKIFPVQCCPRRIQTILNGSFSFAMLSGASRTILPRIFVPYLCNVVPRVLRQHCTRFFPVQCWPMVNRQPFLVK